MTDLEDLHAMVLRYQIAAAATREVIRLLHDAAAEALPLLPSGPERLTLQAAINAARGYLR